MIKSNRISSDTPQQMRAPDTFLAVNPNLETYAAGRCLVVVWCLTLTGGENDCSPITAVILSLPLLSFLSTLSQFAPGRAQGGLTEPNSAHFPFSLATHTTDPP